MRRAWHLYSEEVPHRRPTILPVPEQLGGRTGGGTSLAPIGF
jgi:hypothetical protein